MEGKLRVSFKQLNLGLTLPIGQAFRWKKMIGKDNEWIGVIGDHAISLRQDESHDEIHYKVFNSDINGDVKMKVKANGKKKIKLEKDDVSHLEQEKISDVLHDYFNLSTCMSKLYAHWSSVDTNFSKTSLKFPGVRILRQDPVENLFSFICSSNNNISRISQMVNNLCLTYGNLLCHIDGHGDVYSFPTIEKLSQDGVEQKLRQLGFGYRAKFIQQAAKMIMDKSKSDLKSDLKSDSNIIPASPKEWLLSLRRLSYEECHSQLIELPGVGAKVADCVCLMSLDCPQAIPVDTHVWQISCKHYLPHLKKNKTLTGKTYKEVGDFFRDKFGSHAGWAQTILFCADLRQFKD